MVAHMDEGVGRILDALDETGAARDTLVVFTSDNGGERFSDTWPFVGQKMDLLEGGIRVPLLARWPARIPPGRVTAQVAITMDWVATFLAAAGVAAHPDYPLDGMDLRPALDRPEAAVDRTLFWRVKHRDQRAIRAGSWKYLAIDGHEYLFDLSRDAGSAPTSPSGTPTASPPRGSATPRGRRAYRPLRRMPPCRSSTARRTCRIPRADPGGSRPRGGRRRRPLLS